jgi:hypothetical protein
MSATKKPAPKKKHFQHEYKPEAVLEDAQRWNPHDPKYNFTREQKAFLNHVIKGTSMIEAYKLAYRETDFRDVRASMEKMVDTVPGMREFIETSNEDMNRLIPKFWRYRIKNRLEDIIEKREVLSKIYRGEIVKKVVTTDKDGKVVNVKTYEDPAIRMRAIRDDEKILQPEWDDLEAHIRSLPVPFNDADIAASPSAPPLPEDEPVPVQPTDGPGWVRPGHVATKIGGNWWWDLQEHEIEDLKRRYEK